MPAFPQDRPSARIERLAVFAARIGAFATVAALAVGTVYAHRPEPGIAPRQAQTGAIQPRSPQMTESLTNVYLIDTRMHSAALGQALDEGNNVRLAMGLPPMVDTIIVVETDVDAARIVAAIEEANGIRLTTGRIQITLVDLRSRGSAV